MTLLEDLLSRAEALPFPGAWLPFQALALLLATFCFSSARPELQRCFVLSLPFGLAGALALGALFRWIEYRHAGGPADFVGFASFGALAGVVLAYSVLARRRGASVPDALDKLAAALLVLLGVGRLGCFFGGCDAGKVSGGSFAVRFPAGTQTFRDHVAHGFVLPSDRFSLAVQPVQLYEAALALLVSLLAALSLRFLRDRRPGAIFLAASASYALARCCLDALRPATLGLTAGQWSAAAALLFLLAWHLRSLGPPSVLNQ